MEFVKTILLPCLSIAMLLVANIIAGQSIASIKKEWNKSKFLSGITKAIFTFISILLIASSTYVYNIDIANVNGINVTAITLMNIILVAVIVVYSVKASNKIIELFKVKVEIKDLDKNSPIRIEMPNENNSIEMRENNE